MSAETPEQTALNLGKEAQKAIDKAIIELSQVEAAIAEKEEKHGITDLKEKKKGLKDLVKSIAVDTIKQISDGQGRLFGADGD